MTLISENYHRYFPLSAEAGRWGLEMTSCGMARTAAGVNYPPEKHPADHHFDWKRGRVLDALQIVLITEGRGWLETRETGRTRVDAGMAFLLLPGVWHRYRPDPRTGWLEAWIELRGAVVDRLLDGRIFSAKDILRRGAIEAGLEEVLERVRRRVKKGPAGFQPELAAAGLQALAICAQMATERSGPSRIQRAVGEAERYLSEHHAEPVNMEALARRLGVAYSHFRRAFRAQTGSAPWKYVVHLRLTRARRLLASSDAKLDDVAARVGFSSGFHLSAAFKQAYGQSPQFWRRSLERGADSGG
ncbi:MAG: AraC family transcriptional regulator [Verrucomicrobia bacterium]|nr:AraC family transcriptional regulator [Verrucomicrobiota bacterium]